MVHALLCSITLSSCSSGILEHFWNGGYDETEQHGMLIPDLNLLDFCIWKHPKLMFYAKQVITTNTEWMT
jgi:hypothetical protein